MRSIFHRPAGIAIVIGLAALAFASATLRAQAIDKNETGLPVYPHIETGTQYHVKGGYGPALPAINGKRYDTYVASTPDTLPTVLAWYKHQFSSAKEHTEKGSGPLGPSRVLEVGSDRIEIYIVGKSGTVFELQKYVPGA